MINLARVFAHYAQNILNATAAVPVVKKDKNQPNVQNVFRFYSTSLDKTPSFFGTT